MSPELIAEISARPDYEPLEDFAQQHVIETKQAIEQEIDPTVLYENTLAKDYAIEAVSAAIYVGMGREALNKMVEYLGATKDVMATASLEVDISSIMKGEATTLKWRGRPVFIRHRTETEIEAARRDDEAVRGGRLKLRDPQFDEERVQKPEWLILIGVCTHLGCVPLNKVSTYIKQLHTALFYLFHL